MDFLSILSYGKITSPYGKIQEEVGDQALFSKQDGSGYSQGGRGRFGRGGRDNFNRSNGRPNERNWFNW
jgi:hypothetical protein